MCQFSETEGIFEWNKLWYLRTIAKNLLFHLTTDGLEKYSAIYMINP